MGKVLKLEEERFIFLNASNKPMYDSIHLAMPERPDAPNLGIYITMIQEAPTSRKKN
jgi:hypothetical protein